MTRNQNCTTGQSSSPTSRAAIWSKAVYLLAALFVVQVLFLHQLYEHTLHNDMFSMELDQTVRKGKHLYMDSSDTSDVKHILKLTAPRREKKNSYPGRAGLILEDEKKRQAVVDEFPRIVFLTAMRNMNKPGYFDYLFPKFFALANAISSEFHIVIVENDSNDGTRHALQQRFENDQQQSFVTLVLLDGLQGDRTTILATVRNRALMVAKERFSHYDYFAVLDMDGVCGGPDMSLSYDPDIFKYVLFDLKDEWDVISFRFDPYWDLWAFRHEHYMPSNFFGFHDGRQNKVSQSRDMVPIFNSVLWPNGLIEVQSAFQMFAIYRMSLLQSSEGADNSPRKRDELRGYSGVDDNGQPDCEHVAFHRELREKRNARLRLSPLVYCQGDAGYRPLPRNVTVKFPRKNLTPVPIERKR